MRMQPVGFVAVAAFLLVACTGVVGDPDAEVARFNLYADELGALLSHECVGIYGEEGCSRYPNLHEADSLELSVLGDGRTCGVWKRDGQVVERACGSVADGIPFVCHATPDRECQHCMDIYGNDVLDNCTRGAKLFRARQGGNWDLPEGSAWLDSPATGGDVTQPSPAPSPSTDTPATNEPPPSAPEPSPQPAPEPPPASVADICDDSQARLKYAEMLNKVLSDEGLGISYSPDLSKVYTTHNGFWGVGGKTKNICKYWLQNDSKLTKCDSNEPGRCFCKGNGKPTCRCGRINVRALRWACLEAPADCDSDAWAAALAIEYGVATQWLFKGSYKNAGYYDGLTSYPNPPPPSITCLGSPIVLDLDGGGIEATSIERGVRFDIMGHGTMRTAWVRGSNAFLALDRNGNGRIDDGTELFGSATDIGGAPAADGFEALALFDQPSQGGNGNGLLDEGDLMFGELRLWTDRNGNGVSEPGELATLADAGIRSLEITGRSSGTIIDRHGNDLSLRAGFTRTDGSRGQMIDIFFGVRGE